MGIRDMNVLYYQLHTRHFNAHQNLQTDLIRTSTIFNIGIATVKSFTFFK